MTNHVDRRRGQHQQGDNQMTDTTTATIDGVEVTFTHATVALNAVREALQHVLNTALSTDELEALIRACERHDVRPTADELAVLKATAGAAKELVRNRHAMHAGDHS